MSTSEWLEVAAQGNGITTAQLDACAQKYDAKYAEYEKAKAIATNLYKEAQELEGKFVEAMQLAGKTKYFVEGLGTFSFVDKMSVQTPKTNDQKQLLFDFVSEKMGEVFLLDKLSINSQTLNKLYNEMLSEHQDQLNTEPFIMPGVNPPTNMRSLRFTKAK